MGGCFEEGELRGGSRSRFAPASLLFAFLTVSPDLYGSRATFDCRNYLD